MRLPNRIRTKAVSCIVQHIKKYGEIPTVRLSSARCAGRFPYFDVVRYKIKISKQGRPINVAEERATSAFRSYAKAERKLIEVAKREKRLIMQTIGELTDADLEVLFINFNYKITESVVLDEAPDFSARLVLVYSFPGNYQVKLEKVANGVQEVFVVDESCETIADAVHYILLNSN